MRRLPHQGARYGTVNHGDTSNGVFLLLHLWVLPSSLAILLPNDLPPLSLQLVDGLSVWMALCLVNGGASTNLGLKVLRVQEKGVWTDPWSGSGRPAWADRPRPIPARLGRPFSPMGPHVFMHFSPSTCTILTMSFSRPRWRFSLHEVQSFTLQSSGMFLCNTWVLSTIGSDLNKLINTNKTP
jgi:hypothetical protein